MESILEAINNLRVHMDSRFDQMERRIDGVEVRLDARCDAIEAKFDSRCDGLEARFDELDDRVSVVGEGYDLLYAKIGRIDRGLHNHLQDRKA